MGTRAKPSPRPEQGRGPRVLAGLRPALVAAVLPLLAAPYLGILWEWIAPAPTYVNLSGEVYLNNQDTSEFIAADGWFLILGLLVGIVTGALGYWRRGGDLTVIVALTGSSILASLIAREVGEAFGPAPIQQTALTLADGETISGSIELASDGVLFAWAVGILLTYLSLIVGLERGRSDEEIEEDEAPVAAPDAAGTGENARVEENRNGTADAASVGARGLAGEVGPGQRRQVGEHDPLPAEQRDLGP